MSVLSKILLQDYSMCYNCYELGHTWTPSCSRAALDLGWCTFAEAVKMYTALYTFNQIVSRKADVKATANSARSIVQSSFFLGFNAYAVILIFCLTRRLMGKFYFLLAAHIPAVIGSYLAIQLERPSRRPLLSFYVANVAGETVFKKMIHNGWFPVIPRGEVALFSASAAGLLYLIHKNGFGRDPVSFGLRFLLGSEFIASDPASRGTDSELAEKKQISGSADQEQGSAAGEVRSGEEGGDNNDVNRIREQEISEISDPHSAAINSKGSHNASSQQQGSRMTSDHSIIINFSCPHSRLLCPSASAFSGSADSSAIQQHRTQRSSGTLLSQQLLSLSKLRSLLSSPTLLTPSCTLHAVHAFVRNFLLSFTAQTVVSALMKSHLMMKEPGRLMRDSLLKDNRSLKVALFVASFSCWFKASNCAMRSACRRQPTLVSRMFDEKAITLVSGLVAGSSMLLNPSSTAAQYMMWKLVETVYFEGVRKGSVKYVDFTMSLLYAVSTAQLFYIAVMEPKMMRKSYTKWLNRVTRNAFGLLNRGVINTFGTDASFGYTIPDLELDISHCSEKFKESVLVWMI